MFGKLMNCECSSGWSEWGHLALRASLGLVFFMHGWQKVFMMGIPGVTGFLTSLGFPMPGVFAYILAYGELVFGAMMIIGLLTHWVAKYHVIVALVALVTVHLSKGFFVSAGGYEFILLILAASLAILFSGPGKYSVDKMMLSKDHSHAM
jgi:putative oxidoreductase